MLGYEEQSSKVARALAVLVLKFPWKGDSCISQELSAGCNCWSKSTGRKRGWRCGAPSVWKGSGRHVHDGLQAAVVCVSGICDLPLQLWYETCMWVKKTSCFHLHVMLVRLLYIFFLFSPDFFGLRLLQGGACCNAVYVLQTVCVCEAERSVLLWRNKVTRRRPIEQEGWALKKKLWEWWATLVG